MNSSRWLLLIVGATLLATACQAAAAASKLSDDLDEQEKPSDGADLREPLERFYCLAESEPKYCDICCSAYQLIGSIIGRQVDGKTRAHCYCQADGSAPAND